MKKTLTLMVLLATLPALTLTLSSCDLILSIIMILLDGGDGFYAKNLTNNSDYKVAADLLTKDGSDEPYGKYCRVYQEKNAKGSLSRDQLITLSNYYDNHIRGILVDKFSMKQGKGGGTLSYTDNGETETFENMLEFANWAVGGTDGRLTILLLDIKDGWAPGKGYVAGYFWGGNFLNTTGSNGKDMIYIDTYPALDPSVRKDPVSVDDLLKGAYSTLAHEGQHLVNFITSLYLLIDGGNEDERILMDTWIDEGLASQSEYFFQEVAKINEDRNFNNVSRCIGFNEDSEGTIAQGNNFFIWGNYPGNSVLDEYATVYLFDRWLYLQANADGKSNTDFFMKIISSQYGDQRAVTGAASEINSDWKDWDKLLGTWMAANYYPKNTTFGYKGDDWLREGKIKSGASDPQYTNFTGIKARAIDGTSAKLAPGEGVYSKRSASFDATSSNNIRYVGISSASTAVEVKNSGSITTGDIIITFNADTDKDAIKKADNNKNNSGETGKLTGGTKDPKASVTQGRSVGRNADPYPIDARELLGRGDREKLLLQSDVFKDFKANIGTVQVQVLLDDEEQQ